MASLFHWRAPASLLVLLAGVSLAGCDAAKPKVPGVEQRAAARKLADARRLHKACGSAETYDRLKAFTFDEANRLRRNAAPVLDAVESTATLRMENPVAINRDEQLDVTVCRGALVLDLPPGVADAFNGDSHLRADVEYSAQAAADGSGLVYQMKGAEPIIYRLAALTLPTASAQRGAAPQPPAPAGELASQDVAPPMPTQAPPPRRPPVAQTPPVETPPPRRAPAERPAPTPPRIAAPAAPRVAVAAAPRTAPPPVQPVAPPPRPVSPPITSRASMNAQPSFSCARVTGRVLRLICTEPTLAAQDRRMSSMFYATLASGDDGTRAALRSSRNRFLAFRDRCATAECVAQTYDDRMAEIRDIAAGN